MKLRSERAAKWRKNNPEKAILARARMRSKTDGLEFTITLDDIKIPEYCPVFGVKLEVSDQGFPGPNAPSLDRKDNIQGYIPGNIFVISNRANTRKSNLTVREVEQLLNYMKKVTF